MKTVIITRGLPGSGKTFWARQMQVEHPGAYKVVCKDDLRAMLDNSKHSKANEAFVLRMRDILILQALLEGKHVIVADTNLNPIHVEHITKLIEDAYQANEKIGPVNIENKNFLDVPIEECIRRDLLRAHPVGEAVIRSQWKQWLKPVPASKPEYDPSLPDAIIVDVDGTLALMNGRGPYEFDKYETDVINKPVREALARLSKHGQTRQRRMHTLVVSGRYDTYLIDTVNWLTINDVALDDIFMRSAGDNRNDSIIKREIYEREIKGKYNVLWVLDDRNRVVDAWRNLGLTCLQVANGDF